jgi:hypothetical protein
MDAAISQALTNAQKEHGKFGGFIDRKYDDPLARVVLQLVGLCLLVGWFVLT